MIILISLQSRCFYTNYALWIWPLLINKNHTHFSIHLIRFYWIILLLNINFPPPSLYSCSHEHLFNEVYLQRQIVICLSLSKTNRANRCNGSSVNWRWSKSNSSHNYVFCLIGKSKWTILHIHYCSKWINNTTEDMQINRKTN